MKQVRVGVIGAGGWTKICHIPGVQSHSAAKVVALSGRRYESAKSQADEFGIPKVYTDYHELINDPEIDAITVSTPNVFHYPIAKAALEKGKHVFSEKPLTMNANEAKDLVRLSTEHGLVNQTAFTFRFLYGVNLARDMVAQGKLGQIFHVRAYSEGGSGLDPQRPAEWRYNRAMAGSGQLGDMGSHLIDLVHYIVGPITGVTGTLQTLYSSRPGRDGMEECDADDHAAMFITCRAPGQSDAAQGEIIVSRIIPSGGRSYVQVFGTEGSLTCFYSRGNIDRLLFAQRGEEQQEVAFPQGQVPEFNHALPKMMGAFVEGILGMSTGPAASFIDGYNAQRVIDAVLESARTGKFVPISSLDS